MNDSGVWEQGVMHHQDVSGGLVQPTIEFRSVQLINTHEVVFQFDNDEVQHLANLNGGGPFGFTINPIENSDSTITFRSPEGKEFKIIVSPIQNQER